MIRTGACAVAFVHPDFDLGQAGLALGPSGALALASEVASVRQAVLLLLSTMPGERLRRPGYGCDLHRLAFAPNDETTHGLAIHYVARALAQWEPRVAVTLLDAGVDPARPEVMRITLAWSIRKSGAEDRLTLDVDLAGGG